MPPLDTHFPVSVIMESRPSASPWQDVSWDAVGVCRLGQQPNAERSVQIIQNDQVEQYVYRHLTLRLFGDECESYYHNLMSPNPSCFVIARENDQGQPVPFLVSMSFDEAHAYQEGDDLVYSVAIPVELYAYLEAYVIEHYQPNQRKKRKRENWKDNQ